jgi:hypothetical protein
MMDDASCMMHDECMRRLTFALQRGDGDDDTAKQRVPQDEACLATFISLQSLLLCDHVR